MTTPLASYTNTRIEYISSGGLGGPEVGFKQLPGQRYLVLAFLKLDSAKYRAKYEQNVDLNLSTDYLAGYITGFVPIDDQIDFATYDYTVDPNLDDSGKRPPGFRGPSDINITFGTCDCKKGQLLNAESRYDDLGIGAIVRQVIGDRLVIRTEG